MPNSYAPRSCYRGRCSVAVYSERAKQVCMYEWPFAHARILTAGNEWRTEHQEVWRVPFLDPRRFRIELCA